MAVRSTCTSFTSKEVCYIFGRMASSDVWKDEVPQEGYPSLRDVAAVTKDKVLDNLDASNAKDIAVVLGSASLTWVDIDGIKNSEDEQAQEKIKRYLGSNPEKRTEVAIEIGTSFSDLYSTWGTNRDMEGVVTRPGENEAGYVSEVSPNLRKNVTGWLIEAVQKDIKKTLPEVANKVAGRIAAGESVLARSDLNELADAVKENVEKVMDNDLEVKEAWDKIQNDLNSPITDF